jgi:hypothetical protein
MMRALLWRTVLSQLICTDVPVLPPTSTANRPLPLAVSSQQGLFVRERGYSVAELTAFSLELACHIGHAL